MFRSCVKANIWKQLLSLQEETEVSEDESIYTGVTVQQSTEWLWCPTYNLLMLHSSKTVDKMLTWLWDQAKISIYAKVMEK